jgi:phosphatidylserine/phosphatidylglycerophosphate/cardiolipin synthase-like enzyme
MIGMNRHVMACLGVVVLGACGGGSGMPDDDGGLRDAGIDGFIGPDGSTEPPVALLEIHARDVWGQALPEDEATLRVTRDGAAVATSGWPVITLPLYDAGSYTIALEADAHWPLEVVATFDGSADPDGVSVTVGVSGEGQGVSVGRGAREVAGASYPTHVVALGLRHQWFSAQGRPARRGNALELFTSGEAAWQSVHDDIVDATESVHMSTWWWESTFEMVRPLENHLTLTPTERARNTILGTLDQTLATKRILVGQFLSQDGIASWLSADDMVRARGDTPDDGFEFLGQANETRGVFSFMVDPFRFRDRLPFFFDVEGLTFDDEPELESTVPPRTVDLTEWPISIDVPGASYHQKFAIVDDTIAYVGGMNLRRVDWDTDEHLVFDPRRMLFDATLEDRQAVADHEELPDTGPRKDYMMRLEGPIVQDVQDVFATRWNHLLDVGAENADNASDIVVVPGGPASATGVQAQVTATLPEPFWEHAIAETWINAVGMAERYVFIEDQYFRIPVLNDVIIERMTEIPGLKLVVITKPVDEFTDPGCEWTHRSYQDLRTRFPTRFFVYQLRAFDIQETFGFDETEERFTNIDVHSKMLIVDDVFLSVGSANKNNRGIVYEGELNVAVYDADFVRAERRRLLGLILPPGTDVADDADAWITQLAEAASWNDFVFQEWEDEGGDISLDGDPLPENYTPLGFVHTLLFRSPDECLIEGVGPDMT